MKTNTNRNRTSSNTKRGPLNRNKQQNQKRSTGLSGVKSRISRPGTKSIVTKPKGDLRQILTRKVKPTSNSKTNSTVSSNVKSRLGLQSTSAKLEAKKEMIAQLKSIQNKKTGVKDAKTTNSQTLKKPGLSNTKIRSDQRNQLSDRKPLNSTPYRQDRESSLKNRNSNSNSNPRNFNSSRRPLDRSVSSKSDFRSVRSSNIKSVTTQPIIIQPQYIPTTQPIIYQQPSHHHSNYDNAPNRYVNRSDISSAPEVLTPTGNSVLVSNLSPKITEDEVAELFGDIGPLMNVQIINSTTALVTYFASQHASKAVKIYNYRLLDNIPMNCTILPQSTTSQNSSQQQPLYSGRMYSDRINSISASSRTGGLRPSYHLGL